MKRILVFNDGMAIGGTEKLLVDLLNHWSGKSRVTLLLPSPSNRDELLRYLHPSIEVKYLITKDISFIRKKIIENILIFFPRLYLRRKNIRSKEYDCVICFKECIYARLLSVMSVRKILWVHNILYKRTYEIQTNRERMAVWLKKKQLNVSQKSYDKYDIVICVSQACRNSYIEILHKGKPPRQNIKVIYNAIDVERLTEKSHDTIEKIDHGKTNFVLITRDSPEKRVDRLINAAARLAKESYKFHIYIIGIGKDRDDSDAILSARGLKEYITQIGCTDNPYPYIVQCNWTLCVSERESFSLVILESMALNIPVISTNCGGPSEILEDGRYGILVENNGEGVYQGMKRVLDDNTLSVKYSSGLKEAVARYNYSRWIRLIDAEIGF